MRLRFTLLVLDESANPTWPSNTEVFVWKTLNSFFRFPSADIFTVAARQSVFVLAHAQHQRARQQFVLHSIRYLH